MKAGRVPLIALMAHTFLTVVFAFAVYADLLGTDHKLNVRVCMVLMAVGSMGLLITGILNNLMTRIERLDKGLATPQARPTGIDTN